MSNKSAILIVLLAVCGYVAFTHITCALDIQCHLLRCGKMYCGISYERQGKTE